MMFKLCLAVLLFASLAMATPAKIAKRSSGQDEALEREDFKEVIEKFVDAAVKGSDALAGVEASAYSALASGGDEAAWEAVAAEFEEELTKVLSEVGPAVEEIGEMTEQLFEETEGFGYEPGCDFLPRYINGEAEAHQYQNPGLGVALAFMEDIGCLKDRFGRARHIDPDEIDDTFSARDALSMSFRILEGAQDIFKSLQSYEELEEEKKKKKSISGAEGDKMDRLIRLLKEMKLDSRKRK